MEIILFYLEFLPQDIFTAFGIYTLIYLILKALNKNQKLISFDFSARKFIILNGLVYFTAWITRTIYFYFQNSGENQKELDELMFGQYSLQFWFQPIFWLILSQLYRVKLLSENTIFRILSSLSLLISLDKLIIFLSVFHRDYLPSSWSISSGLGIYPSNFFLEILIKILIFIFCVIFFDRLQNRINKNYR